MVREMRPKNSITIIVASHAKQNEHHLREYSVTGRPLGPQAIENVIQGELKRSIILGKIGEPRQVVRVFAKAVGQHGLETRRGGRDERGGNGGHSETPSSRKKVDSRHPWFERKAPCERISQRRSDSN